MRWRCKWQWSFRLPFKKWRWLNIDLGSPWSLPRDYNARALAMLLGKIPADPEFLARAWFHESSRRTAQTNQYLKDLRVLERKVAAQKTELRRLLKSPRKHESDCTGQRKETP